MRDTNTDEMGCGWSHFDETVSVLLSALPAALDTLERLMRCGNPVVEIKAARFLLDFNDRIERAKFASRVEALENRCPRGRHW